MARSIKSVAVLGAGTMGSGIAALCAAAGCPVLLLDVRRDLTEKALERMQVGRFPMLEDPSAAERIAIGSFDDLERVADYDWICEVIIEDLATKQELLKKVEATRRDGSIVSSNTSGILLNAITAGMPERLRRDMAVTHFFNPVKLMRLLELVPGQDTSQEVTDALASFLRTRLGKGVVYAKDTINFIANRIGCFWILAGLHKASTALEAGLSMETIDALMAKPVGLPSTGLYGLVDLIGLDVMDLVGKNLSANLPAEDAGRAFAAYPPVEQQMLAQGQLGRKSGGGFYRVTKEADGTKSKQVYDLTSGNWRAAVAIELGAEHGEFRTLMFTQDAEGRFAWDLMSSTLCYAADLVPEISDDIVKIDRAMRWGYNWNRGPFELLDALEPARVIQRLEEEGRPLPRMLTVLRDADATSFYRDNGSTYLGLDGHYHPVPAE